MWLWIAVFALMLAIDVAIPVYIRAVAKGWTGMAMWTSGLIEGFRCALVLIVVANEYMVIPTILAAMAGTWLAMRWSKV